MLALRISKVMVAFTSPEKSPVPTAVMVYEVESIATVGVPLSAPLVALSVKPEGRVGDTEYVAVALLGVRVTVGASSPNGTPTGSRSAEGV